MGFEPPAVHEGVLGNLGYFFSLRKTGLFQPEPQSICYGPAKGTLLGAVELYDSDPNLPHQLIWKDEGITLFHHSDRGGGTC